MLGSVALRVRRRVEIRVGASRGADARGRTQKRRRCGADADRPQTNRFSCCCPCILQGRISARQGRSCLGACCCTVVTAYYAPGCTYFCYDIPDRVQFGKQVSRPRGRSIIPRKYRGDAASGRPLIDTAQGYLEAWLPVLCCFNICGRVQLAKELDIDWKNTDKMKAQASESAEQLKSDAMLRA